MAWLELAKPGTYKDRFGKSYTLTVELLRKIAERYNPAQFMAPITVGHPTTGKEPAWGWIDGLKVVGDRLLFRPTQVVAEFADAVKKGMYANVSGGFDLPAWTLNHVAFLGGAAPAIKGLSRVAGVQFSESNPEGFVAIDLSSSSQSWDRAEFGGLRDSWVTSQIKTIGRILLRLRDQTIESAGLDSANKLLSEWEATDLGKDPPSDPEAAPMQMMKPQFQAPSSGKEFSMDIQEQVQKLTLQVAEFSEKQKALETENAALKIENAKLASDNRKREFAQFCDGLISEHRMLPNNKQSTVDLLESLAAAPKSAQFAEGQKTPLDIYKEQLKTAPVLAEFGEIMTRQNMGDAGTIEDSRFSSLGKKIAESVSGGGKGGCGGGKGK